MGGKLFVFADVFDSCAFIAIEISLSFAKKIAIYMFIDLKQVFDVITRRERPSKKQLTINAQAAKMGTKHLKPVALV